MYKFILIALFAIAPEAAAQTVRLVEEPEVIFKKMLGYQGRITAAQSPDSIAAIAREYGLPGHPQNRDEFACLLFAMQTKGKLCSEPRPRVAVAKVSKKTAKVVRGPEPLPDSLFHLTLYKESAVPDTVDLSKWRPVTKHQRELVKTRLALIAREEGLNEKLFVAVMGCDGHFNPTSTAKTPREHSVGVIQINLLAHRQVTEAQARNVEWAARWAAPLFRTGAHKHWRNCYRTVMARQKPKVLASRAN